jgi:hypothetical protein
MVMAGAIPDTQELHSTRRETKMNRLFLLLLTATAVIAQPPIDPAKAKAAFDQAHELCSADNGKLWGHTLCGPMLFADRATFYAVGNQADESGKLQAENGVFVGKIPMQLAIANTATSWDSVIWSEVVWPLPDDARERGILLMHESFHRLQMQQKLLMKNPGNDHLDTLRGRYLFRLELRAYNAALRAEGKGRADAIHEALTFRAARAKDFPGSAQNERDLETNEGLAEYTGYRLGGGDPKEALESGDKRPSLVRSSAYITGPALGFLLDVVAPDWHAKALAKEPMDELLAKAVQFREPADLDSAVASFAKHYGGAELLAQETARDEETKRRQAEYRAKLVDGPVLRIPLEKMNISFNPNKLFPLDDLGTVYPEMRITDNWGVLEVTNGMALLNKTWDAVTVQAMSNMSGNDVSGAGWTLHLNSGYKLIAGARKGDFTVGKTAEK